MFHIAKSVEGVPPLSTGCQREIESNGTERILGTASFLKGDVSIHTHKSAKTASMTKRSTKCGFCQPPWRKFTTCEQRLIQSNQSLPGLSATIVSGNKTKRNKKWKCQSSLRTLIIVHLKNVNNQNRKHFLNLKIIEKKEILTVTVPDGKGWWKARIPLLPLSTLLLSVVFKL